MRIFVYGTLKRGGRLHRWLEICRAEFVGEHVIDGWGMLRLAGPWAWFPAMAERKGAQVRGEIFDIPDEYVPIIDMVESDAFARVEIEEGIVAWVWAWEIPRGTTWVEGDSWPV